MMKRIKHIVFVAVLGVLCLSYATANTVGVKVQTATGIKTIEVDENSVQLRLMKLDGIVDIKGLDRLHSLEKIVLDMTGDLGSLRFLSDVPQLEVLVLSYVTIDDFAFLNTLTELRQLVLRRVSVKNGVMCLDLSEVPHLEYLEFSYSKLQSPPILANVPNSLSWLNLGFNEISVISSCFINAISPVEHVILSFNPIATETRRPKNSKFYYGDPWVVLPREYVHITS